MAANNVVDTLQVNIQASSVSAKKSIDDLCDSLAKLKASLDGIGNQKIKVTVKNIEETGNASEKTSGKMLKLQDAAKKVGAAFGSASLKGLKSFTQGVVGLGKAITGNLMKTLGIKNPFKNLTNGGFSLLSMVGKLYAGFWMLRTAFGWIKDSVDFASNLVEVQNVVRNAFGPEAEKMVNDFAGSVAMLDFGMSELTTKTIASKFQAMGKALGVTDQQVVKTQKTVSGLPETYDEAADSIADVSLNLTKLAADMGSFYNQDPEQVAKSLEAVFTGQTRPLRQYGLDLTQATLSEWAMKQGIDADVASMTQAEKTMLRYQYVMNNAKLSMGDFAATANTWANVVKTLKQQFQALGGIIGGVFVNAFKPALIALRGFMQNVLDFAKTVADALGAIFGWTIEITASGSGVSDTYEDLSDSLGDAGSGAGDVGSGLGDGAKAAKAIEKSLSVLPFDELNQLAKDTGGGGSGGGSGGSGGGGGSGSGGGLSGNGASAALVRTESVMEKITSSIKTLDELGTYISETLAHALEGIKWNDIYEKARSFGTGLATFLNSLITPELFSALGHTIAGALNTAIEASFGFNTTFNWTNLGNSIAVGINRFAADFNLPLAVESFNAWANGILDTLTTAIGRVQWAGIGTKISEGLSKINIEEISSKFGELWKTKFVAFDNFTSNINWDTFGTKLGTSINNFFSNLKLERVGASLATAGNAIIRFVGSAIASVNFGDIGSDLASGLNKFFSTIDFVKLGVSVSGLVTGVLDFFNKAIGQVKWGKVGESIGDFLANINWGEILVGSAKLIGNIAGGILSLLVGAVASLVTNAASGLAKLGSAMLDVIKNAFTTSSGNIPADYWGDSWSLFVKNMTDSFIDVFKISPKDAEKAVENFFYNIKSNIDIAVSQIKQKIYEGLASFAEEHPVLADILGIDAGELRLKATAEIDKQEDLRKEQDRHLPNTADMNKSQNNLTQAQSTISAWAQYDAAKNGTLYAKGKEGWRTISTWAQYNASKMNLSAKQRTIAAWANFTSSHNNLSKNQRTIGAWAKYTQRIDALSKSQKTINVIARYSKTSNYATTKYTGGLFRNGRWQPIQSFASGGSPYGGQIFRARENGNPELVGTLKGSTAVLNNDQIVASVSSGVARAIAGIRFQMQGFRPTEIDMNALGNMIQYAVVSALANNATERPIDVYATIKTQNDEVLARAVARGNRSLNYRDSAVAGA